MFKFLVVTDQDWVVDKLPDIRFILGLSPDLEDAQFAIKYAKLTPEVKDGRITETWFQEHITKDAVARGYMGAVLHVSEKQGKTLKLKDGLRGSHFGDQDGFMECWVVADEGSVVKFKDGTKRDKFVKVVCHEIGHGFKNLGFTKLEVHDYDYQNTKNDIEGFYEDFRVLKDKQSNLTQQVGLLQRILLILGLMKEGEYDPILPVHASYWNRPTQEYGVRDKRYTLTGVHIGVDFPCPVGTPIKARMNGTVTKTGTTAALGNYCYFEFMCRGKTFVDRYLHLRDVPTTGKFRQGDIIGYTGNTGQTTGPHLHIDTWRGAVRSGINPSNWAIFTIDPRLVDKV